MLTWPNLTWSDLASYSFETKIWQPARLSDVTVTWPDLAHIWNFAHICAGYLFEAIRNFASLSRRFSKLLQKPKGERQKIPPTAGGLMRDFRCRIETNDNWCALHSVWAVLPNRKIPDQRQNVSKTLNHMTEGGHLVSSFDTEWQRSNVILLFHWNFCQKTSFKLCWLSLEFYSLGLSKDVIPRCGW